jgi:hypothetical protein
MPNDWETANGLNPNSNDANGYALDPYKYYTNLEVYLNSLVQDIMINGNKHGDNAVKEYYPAYHKADGTFVAAINADVAGIEEITSGEVIETLYYNVQGMRIEYPSKGTFIRVNKLSNGKKDVKKIIIR